MKMRESNVFRIVPIIFGIFLLVGCAPTDRYVDLEDVIANAGDDSLYSGENVVTGEYCPDAPDDCLEAVQTDQARYVKFKGDDEAQSWVDKHPEVDARRTGWIVITYLDPALSEEDRQALWEGMAGAHEDLG